MYKLWKIGTSISTYVTEIELWKGKGVLDFEVQHDGKEIVFICNNGEEFKKKKSTATQFIRSLLSLNLIEANRLKFDKDKSVIASGTHYTLYSLNKNETIGDFISASMIGRTSDVLGENKCIYPTDGNFVFSLMATYFSIRNKKNEKYLNLRLESGKIDQVKKYYSGIANIMISSPVDEQLSKSAREYVIGFDTNTEKLVKSINGELAIKTRPIYSEKNLEEQIISKPYTFGKFVEDYFTAGNNITIPIYQRKYIWSDETVKTLLNDILKLRATHYIGNVIVKSRDTGNMRVSKIIDGQQRLTTLCLIQRAVFDFSKYMNFNVDRQANEKFDETSSNSIVKTFTRVDGNSDFKAFFSVMGGRGFEEDLASSQIIENYKTILNWMTISLKNEAGVEKFWKNLLNGITLVVINDKASNEYKLFEKLNTGATPLTTIELFKNYILDKFSEERGMTEVAAQELFEEKISSNFKGKSKETDIDTFITTLLRKENSIISSETLFNQYKDLIETKYIENTPNASLKEVLSSISDDIKLYKEISTYKKYNDRKSFANGYSDFLYMFDGRTVYFPLIIRLIEQSFNDHINPTIPETNNLRKLLRVIEVFEVRLQIASYRGQSLSSKIEAILQSMGDDIKPNELWDLFSKGSGSLGMASIDVFADALASQAIANKPAKLIMTRIENYFHLKDHWNISKDTKFLSMYDKPSQREHLLPSKWEDNWKSYLETQTKTTGDELAKLISDSIDFIGNAFPIPAWSNAQVKNQSLETKKTKFDSEPYSKQVAMFNGIKDRLDGVGKVFSIKEIKERSKQISEIAREIWADIK